MVSDGTIAIAGIPRSGKTTFAQQVAGYTAPAAQIFHTDHLQFLEWSQVSEIAADWFDLETGEKQRIIEGVTVIRALRKWLRSHEKAHEKTHEKARPCEQLYWLGEARMGLSRGQATLARGCATIFSEIRPQLEARGVVVKTPGGVIERWKLVS